MPQIVLIVAAAIGVLADAFFAIVNFYPVAPHPSRGPKRYIVMQLDDDQAAWFTSNVLADFNDEHDANLELIRVTDEEQLQPATQQAIAQGKDVVAVALPATQIDEAIANKVVRPYTDIVPASRIAEDFHRLGKVVLSRAQVDGKQYFLPRMAIIDVAVYRASKVRDAVLHWSLLRSQIDASLAKINGRGLPAGYELGLDPRSWDAYDLYVMAYYWAHRSYGGKPARPRVAHRTGDDIDGQRDILAGVYRLGATDANVATYDAQAARDYFQWEALYRGEGLYPEGMYASEPFDDEAVLDGLEKGELFFAPIDSMEGFDLHGGAHEGAVAHAEDPQDLEFTAMPSGASLALDGKGQPVRTRDSFAFREDWLWAVPAGAKAPQIGYELVKFLWKPRIHARECEALGMLPEHPDVVAQRVSRFRLEWMSHVFEAGLDQEKHGEAMPHGLVAKGVGSVYAQLWTKLVAGGVPAMPEEGIEAVLKAPPKPKALATEAAGASVHEQEAGTGTGSGSGTGTGTGTGTGPEAEAGSEAGSDAGSDAGSGDTLEDWESDAVLENVGGRK